MTTRLIKATLHPTSDLPNFTPIVTRSGATATRVSERGLLEVMDANTQRFDYDPLTNACRGLLMEPGSVNLVLQSQNFALSWTAVDSPTRTAAAVVTGQLSLDLIGDTSATTLSLFTQNVSFTGNAVKAVSIFMKFRSAATSRVVLRDTTASANRLFAEVNWNSSTGVPSVVMTTGTHVGTDDYGNGIYRFRFRATTVTAANTNALEVYPAAFVVGGSALASIGGVYAGGVQAENAENPTSYIPTTTATVTRNADVFKLTALTGWFVAGTGSLLIEWVIPFDYPTSLFERIVSLNDNSSSNRISFYNGTSADLSGVTLTSGGVSQSDFTNGAVYAYGTTVRRQAAAWATNDVAMSSDGTAVGTDATATIPTVTQLEFGGESGGGPNQITYLRRVAYYPKRLTNADLQTLSGGGSITDVPSLSFDFTGGALESQTGALTKPRIAWQNVMRDLTAGSVDVISSVSGFPKDAPLRPDTWQSYIGDSSPTLWQANFGSLKTINYVGLVAAVGTCSLEWSTDNTVWNWIVKGATSLPADLILFPSVSAQYIRIKFDSPTSLYVAFAGTVLTMERHPLSALQPLNLSRETELTQSLSQSGNLLGQTIRKMGFSAPIGFQSLTPSFVRSTFDPFVESSRSYPYFIAWNASEFPDEVAYGWTPEDIKPRYMGDRPLMEVSWNVVGFDA